MQIRETIRGWKCKALAHNSWPLAACRFLGRHPVLAGILDLTAGTTLLLVSLALLPRGVSLAPILLTFAGFAIISRSSFASLMKSIRNPVSVSAQREADLHETLEKLYRERQQLAVQLDELAVIREVSLAVGSILDFGDMIRAILDLVTSHFGISKALIYLRSQEEDWFEIVGARANDRNIAPSKVILKKIRLGTGLVGQAAAERRELIEMQEGKGVIAAVPLVAKSKVVGVMKLSDPDPAKLSPENCRKLHTIAGAIAVALENSRLYRMAVTDGLTGLYVHRHFQHRLEEEFARSLRYGTHLALLMVDIDHFKQFNDTHGHRTGDEVLKGVATILSEEARGTDVVCRYGGEEMAIICPQTDIAGAIIIGERIRSRTDHRKFEADGVTDPLHVTVSIGIAVYQSGMEKRSDLVESADVALYHAKKNGRNRVSCADAELRAA